MFRFSETLMDHFQDPRHQGRLERPDAVGQAGVPNTGRSLAFYLQIDRGVVTEAWFEGRGCGVTIACGSIVTELTENRSTDDCARLTAEDVASALDGLPADKFDRAVLAIVALRDALRSIKFPENAVDP